MRRELVSKFSRKLDALERTQGRAESLFARKRLLKTDAETIYEGLFLRAVTGFEEFLETYFYLVVDERAGFPKKARVRCQVKASSSQLREIVLHGRDYVDWLPFDRLSERASIFLVGGRPFSSLSQPQQQAIARAVAVRHAIAHSSRHARQKFEKLVLGSQVLRPSERRPAAYLRSVAILPDVRRFNLMLGDLRTSAIALTV